MSVPSSPKAAARHAHRRSVSVPAVSKDRHEYGVMQPVSDYYDAGAEKISNMIDDELKVRAIYLLLSS